MITDNIHLHSEEDFKEEAVLPHSKNLLIHFESLGSTNTFAKTLTDQLINRDLTVILADEQTTGRGRMERKWYSKPGKSLTFTIIKSFSHEAPITCLPLLTALSLSEAFEKYTSLKKIDIKWPNDLLIEDKKVAGILIENKITSLNQILYIGVGININQENFPEEISSTACNLQTHSQIRINRLDLLSEFLIHLTHNIKRLNSYETQNIFSDYSKRSSYVKGKQISYYENDKEYFGTTDGLDDNGALFILDENKKRKPLIISEIHTVRNQL